MNKLYISSLIFAFFASISFAASPYFFQGYAHVNGSLAPNGTIVEVFLNGTSTVLGSAIVGEGSLGGTPPGWYTLGFEGTSENIVSFRVNNLTLISANGTNVTAQALGSSVIHGGFNLSVNKSSNGASCLYAIGCSSGFCSSSYCCDTACTASGYSCSVSGSVGTCTSTSTSSSSSSGGGGGGSSTSTTSETVSLVSVPASSTASVSISSAVSANVGVEKIEFTAATTVSNVQITVKETTQSAAGVSVAISSSAGSVYKYIEITKNIKDAEVASAKINFKVPKSWLTSNNIDKSTVALQRFSNGWTKLATTLSSEDSTYVYYSSASPGFSTFAVTGQKSTSQPAPVSSSCGNNTREAGEECDGTDLAAETCVSKGFVKGILKCSSSCRFDTSGCVAAPSFSITSPTSGQKIYGTAVTVSFSVSGVTLTPATGAVIEGEGHLHLFLDNQPYVLSSTPSYTFSDVPYGQHTLRAELHRGDHTAFSPAVEKTVSFTSAAKEQPTTPTTPSTGKQDYTIGIIILVVIIIAGAAFMMRKKPKKASA